MAEIKPFYCIRPVGALASRVAALPYDVYSREEAEKEVEREPLSFLHIDRAETWFSEEVDTFDPRVYEKAGEVLKRLEAEGVFLREKAPCYYLYELTMGSHVQTGLVACSSVDDYLNHVVKRHENTREDKEQDRICHVDVTNAQTGPIFLAYRARKNLKMLEESVKKEAMKKEGAVYDFLSPDGVRHRVFRIAQPERMERITEEIAAAGCTYIADGHHRAASAVKVALKRRREYPGYRGDEEFNYFLSVLFPDDELKILAYNRVVQDLNGLSAETFLEKVKEKFRITAKMPMKVAGERPGAGKIPEKKGEFCMLLQGIWYTMEAGNAILSDDPVDGLDVSLLQNHLLAPVLGIGDPRTDRRIQFIGGIRGTKELERRASEPGKTAFSLYPTSMEELLAVADAGRLMPPKSTWFEPKLRSGLFIHRLG